MKVILYMAMTVNGIISRENDDTDLVSGAEWGSFARAIKKFGCIIIGRRTYDVMNKGGEFSKLGKVRIVVVTGKAMNTKNADIVSAASPKDAIEILKKDGYKTVIVAGGGSLNGSFMKDDIINEIYLDVEPVVLGKGIRLFSDVNFESRLTLMGIKKLSKNEIQLHYKIRKR